MENKNIKDLINGLLPEELEQALGQITDEALMDEIKKRLDKRAETLKSVIDALGK